MLGAGGCHVQWVSGFGIRLQVRHKVQVKMSLIPTSGRQRIRQSLHDVRLGKGRVNTGNSLSNRGGLRTQNKPIRESTEVRYNPKHAEQKTGKQTADIAEV